MSQFLRGRKNSTRDRKHSVHEETQDETERGVGRDREREEEGAKERNKQREREKERDERIVAIGGGARDRANVLRRCRVKRSRSVGRLVIRENRKTTVVKREIFVVLPYGWT